MSWQNEEGRIEEKRRSQRSEDHQKTKRREQAVQKRKGHARHVTNNCNQFSPSKINLQEKVILGGRVSKQAGILMQDKSIDWSNY